MLPAELQRLLDEIEACERDCAALVADLDDVTVNWAEPGKWSVAQCLDHLAVMNELYLRGLHVRVQQARAAGNAGFCGVRPTLLGRWFAHSMEPPARFKQKAPKVVRPRATFARAHLLPAYVASHGGYRTLVQASADVDVNRITLPNPFVKPVRMRLATVLLLIPAHDRRHLWQAHNVKDAITRARDVRASPARGQ